MQARAAELGVEHCRLRIRDFDPFDLRLRLPEAVALVAQQAKRCTVYIHCTAGRGLPKPSRLRGKPSAALCLSTAPPVAGPRLAVLSTQTLDPLHHAAGQARHCSCSVYSWWVPA